jgi:hypothetical protein
MVNDLVLVPLFVVDESPYIVLGRVIEAGRVMGISFRNPFEAPMHESLRLLVRDVQRVVITDTCVTIWSPSFTCMENVTWMRLRCRLQRLVGRVLLVAIQRHRRRVAAQVVISRHWLRYTYAPGGPGYQRCARSWEALDRA